MAESYFALSNGDQAEVLELGRERTGRPVHLLEKDVWVVWTLGILFGSPARDQLCCTCCRIGVRRPGDRRTA